MRRTGNRPPAAVPQAFPELSDREHEVLVLIVQGHTNAEIAARLVISLKTARNHVSNILSKLQVADRAQAVIRARRWFGIETPQRPRASGDLAAAG